MTNKSLNIPKSETFTWLQPGTWRKPCIVHVTMVANSRQALFGKLTHNGSEALVEKTPIGWALINQQRRLLELCPEIKILADKVMPDHHHIVLQVQRTMPRSIREVLRGYMLRRTEVCGLLFTSMGNHFLLEWPDRQLVEMSRSASEEQIADRLKEVMVAAHNGTVTYTAAISKGEQKIARTVHEHGFPLVVLLNEGSPSMLGVC